MLPTTPPAIQTALGILARHRALFGGKARAMPAPDIAQIVRIFEEAGAKWALVGAHAVGLLTEPRATVDFDFVIEERKLRAVLARLRDEFGDLDEDDMGAGIRLRALDVDLIRSSNHPLFREAIERTTKVADWNVPRTEVLLVLKFLAAVSPWRNADRRAQDMVDLRTVYRAVGRESLDARLMMDLAAQVYPGAEAGFKELLDRIDRGEPIAI